MLQGMPVQILVLGSPPVEPNGRTSPRSHLFPHRSASPGGYCIQTQSAPFLEKDEKLYVHLRGCC